MATRVVEGKKPYTGGKAISIDENKVISLNLRDENNLIIYDAGDDEIYVDLQLDDEITPTSAFPIGVNVGRVIVDNGWDKPGTIISAETTSGDNIKIFYADEGTLWIDNGTGTFKQIYFKADVDALLLALRNYIDGELAKKQNGVSSDTAPENPSEGDLWYDTTNSAMKVWDGTAWQSVGTGGGGSDIVYATQAEYNALLPGALTDNKHYFIYTSDSPTPPTPWQPGADAIAYFPFDTDMIDALGNKTLTTIDNGISITTTDGVSALYNNGSGSAKINVGFNNDSTGVPSVLMWIKPVKTTNSFYIGERSTSGGDQDRSFKIDGNKFTYLRWNSGEAGGIYNIVNPGGWVCVGIIDTTSGITVYINGTKYSDATATTYTILTPDVGILCRYNAGSYQEKTEAYMSKLVLYNTAITENDYMNYYNQTKGDYGIS